MQPLFYSTGQVARQLGTTLAAIRVLCENRVIAAETTPGGHLRVPASEVERIKREGLPPIPRPLPTESASPARNGTAGRHGHLELLAEPSDEVVSAADQVAITRSMLEKRKIDRELEETEDWFRARQRAQNFDNLRAVVGADLHGSFNDRLALIFQNMQLICSNPQIQSLCSQYKSAIHPHLPVSVPLIQRPLPRPVPR